MSRTSSLPSSFRPTRPRNTFVSILRLNVLAKLKLGYCELDLIKKEIYPTDPDYEHNLRHHVLFSDAIRLEVFKRAIEQFERLARTHTHIVVDEPLHKERLRVLRNPLGMYWSLKAAFETFHNVDVTFENNGPLAESVATLTDLVKDKLAAFDARLVDKSRKISD